ncbi:MAG: phage tail protein [Rhizorhabdus sp.]
MKKPEGLRRLLEATVPGLAANPDRLEMHVDVGRVAAREGSTLSFQYRYTLTIVVQDFASDVDMLTVPLIAWIAKAQPELLRVGNQEPFQFRAEILDDQRVDVEFTLELSENVRVVARAGGGYDVAHLPEPAAEHDCVDDGEQNLWRIFLNDELVAESDDPAAHQ